MRVSHILYIFCQLHCKFPVIVVAVLFLFMGMTLPGTGMHFIDGHGGPGTVPAFPLLHPFLIVPGEMINIRHNGRIARTLLRIERKGIRFIEILPRPGLDEILVHASFLQLRNKCLVDPQGLQPGHLISVRTPAVEFSDHAYVFGIGRPYCKIDTFLAVYLGRMCAQLLIDLVMCPFTEEILIHIRYRAPGTLCC